MLFKRNYKLVTLNPTNVYISEGEFHEFQIWIKYGIILDLRNIEMSPNQFSVYKKGKYCHPTVLLT